MGLRQVPARLGIDSCFGKRTWEWEARISRSSELVRLTNNQNTAQCHTEHSTCIFVIIYNKAATLNQCYTEN